MTDGVPRSPQSLSATAAASVPAGPPASVDAGAGREPSPDVPAPTYQAELEINDFPQAARFRVTHKSHVAGVAELTGAALITKGVYVPPGADLPPGERKMYLLIQGPTEACVRAAKAACKRVIEEHTEKAMRRDAGAAGTAKYRTL